MSYVDVVVAALPRDRVEEYKQLTRESASLWREYGATSYVEAIGDDVPYGELTSFPRAVQAHDDEVVVVSWMIYPSREVRDAAGQRMMSDPRMAELMRRLPVDGKRMIFGGFEPFIE